MSSSSEQRNGRPMPPYNATNFNSENPLVFNTLKNNARTQPQYPLPVGADANQVYRNTANVMYYNALNMRTSAIRAQNDSLKSSIPYPTFKTEGERIMYRQGMATTAARTQITGENPAVPMGVPLTTIYQIINQ